MSFRTTYILFGLLGGLVLIFGITLWLTPPTKIDSDFVFPSAHDKRTQVEAKQIVQLEIERKGDDVHLVFKRDEEGQDFELTTPGGYRVDSGDVATAVSDVLDARAVKGDLTGKLKSYGLEPPQGKVTLKTKAGKELVLNLGDTTGERIYVTTSDAPKQPRVVGRSSIRRILGTLDTFRARKLVPYSRDDIKLVRLQKGNKESDTVELQASGTGWRYSKPDYGAAEVEGSKGADGKAGMGVHTLLDDLIALRTEGPSPDDKEPKDKKDKKDQEEAKAGESRKELGFIEDNAKDLAKYGLTDNDAYLVLEAKKDPAAKSGITILIGKEIDKTDYRYARVAPDRHVLSVSKKKLEPFEKLLADKQLLRDRKLVRLGGQPDVIRIDYAGGKTIHLFRTSGGGGPHGFAMENWTLYAGDEKTGVGADASAVKGLLDMLNAPEAVKQFPENKKDPALGLDDPKNLKVSLWVGGIQPKQPADKDKEKKEEKKDERPELKNAKPELQLIFGRAEGNLVAVKRLAGRDQAQEDVFKVKDDLLKTASQDPLAYRDRSLPPFFANIANVNKVTVEFEGKPETVVERKKADDANSDWVLKAPKKWEGRKADADVLNGDILHGLTQLKVQKWVTLEAKGTDLGGWGLAKPFGRIALETKVDNKPEKVELLIGKLTDDREGYFAKRSDKDWIFVVSKNRIDGMNVPLRDTRVLAFQPADVKSIRFRGWERRGDPLTLEVEKKGTTWEGKGLREDERLEVAELDNLVNALSDLKAKKFLETEEKPEHGLDVKKGALEIEITLNDKEKPKLVLTIGATEAEGFHASSNQVPKEVFVIGKGENNILEKAREKFEFLVPKKK